jgi:hypothetical protein
MKSLRQIFAIARTEFLFGYRRPGPAFIALIAGITVAAGTVSAFYPQIPNNRECLDTVNKILADPTKAAAIATAAVAGTPIPPASDICAEISSDFYTRQARGAVAGGIHDSWFSFLLFSFVFITASAAPAIAADRQFGATEWLYAMPINGGIYLLGKILGLFTSALAGSLIPLLLFSIIIPILMHTLPLGLMLTLAGMEGLPVLLWSISFGVLIGTPFRKRMNVAFLGVGLGLASLITWLYIFYSPTGRGNTIDIVSFFVFQRFGLEAGIVGRVSFGQVQVVYLSLLATVCILGFLARLWLIWKENF